MLFSLFALALQVHPEVALNSRQYSSDLAVSLHEDLNVKVQSPNFEGHFLSFFEQGSGRDQSIDVDPLVIRKDLNNTNIHFWHFWLGRTLPLIEEKSEEVIKTTSAIGANWVQNQSQPLAPRVSGWVGTGLQWMTGSVFGSLMFSPIFLPTFGPALDFSDSGDASGSRFSRLPPESVRIENIILPVRYRIDKGNVKDIVLQNQVFCSLGIRRTAFEAQVMGWSAPSPNPRLEHSEVLRIRDDLDVLVAVHPHFFRENFLATRISVNPSPKTTLIAELLYETISHRIVSSVEWDLSTYLSLGGLHTFGQVNNQSDYAFGLFWAEVLSPSLFDRLTASLRYEGHYGSRESRGNWVRPRLLLKASPYLQIFGEIDIFNGTDQSYFGAWRSLDFAQIGLIARW